GEPLPIDRLHSRAQPARGFAERFRTPRRVYEAGRKRNARKSLRHITRPDRPSPLESAAAARARAWHARAMLCPGPSAEYAAMPRAPDAVSLRRPAHGAAPGILAQGLRCATARRRVPLRTARAQGPPSDRGV